jgi:hypothetical protein
MYRLLFDSIACIITGDGPLTPVSQYLASLSVLEKAVFVPIYVCSTSDLWILRINILMKFLSRLVYSS